MLTAAIESYLTARLKGEPARLRAVLRRARERDPAAVERALGRLDSILRAAAENAPEPAHKEQKFRWKHDLPHTTGLFRLTKQGALFRILTIHFAPDGEPRVTLPVGAIENLLYRLNASLPWTKARERAEEVICEVRLQDEWLAGVVEDLLEEAAR